MRLGLSAEKENRVLNSGFDSLILALNQVMLKVLLRVGADCYVDQPAVKNLDSVAKPHSELGCVDPSLNQLAGSFTEGAFRTQKWKLDTPADILVFDGSREYQSDEFKGKRYHLIFHQVAVTSLTDGLIRSLNSLRFPVVAAQSKNECALRFLYLFGGTRRKSSVKDFLEKEIGGPCCVL